MKKPDFLTFDRSASWGKRVMVPAGLLLIAVPLFLFASGMASAVSHAVSGLFDNDALGLVTKYKPSISVENTDRTLIAEKGTQLMSGDTVTTNENGFALIQFIDASFARIKPHTELVVRGEVVNGRNTATRIGMEAGEIFLNVTQRSITNFEVATSTTVASVRGTEFGATFDNYFYVVEGEVELLSETGQTASITENMYGQVNEDGTIDTGNLTAEQIADLMEDYGELEEQSTPRVLRLRFVDANGQIRIIEIELYDN